MGLFSKIIKTSILPSKKNPMKWATPFVSQLSMAKKHYLDRYGQTPYVPYTPNPAWARELAQRLGDEGEGSIGELTRKTEARLLNAGMHEAAAASAAARLSTAATRLRAGEALDFWESLTKSANDRMEEADGINTFGSTTAFTHGFLGTGGGQGVANTVKSFGR